MRSRHGTGLQAIVVVTVGSLLVACGSGQSSLLTRPKPGNQPAPARGAITPFGAPPVAPPAALRDVARHYYEGAGPDPDSDRQDNARPVCLLMVPTSLRGAPVRSVPRARFNIFAEFEVTWLLASGRGTGLTLRVYPPGDPSDLEFLAPDATVATLPDGTELRTTPQRPRATLVRVPTQNCEYELEAAGPVSSAALDEAVRSLRLVGDP